MLMFHPVCADDEVPPFTQTLVLNIGGRASPCGTPDVREKVTSSGCFLPHELHRPHPPFSLDASTIIILLPLHVPILSALLCSLSSSSLPLSPREESSTD